MIETLSILLLLFCGLVLFLHIFSLPANWVVLAFVILWKLTGDPGLLSWQFVGVLALIASVGELIEFIAQYYGGKRSGSSTRGGVGGLVGAIIGAILGAPFFLGLGALAGALAGAWAGCLIIEMGQGRQFPEANKAALGTMWGKFFGTVAKLGLGVLMVVLLAGRIWPWL